MRPRFTLAGMLWFAVLVGFLCTAGALGYELRHPQFPDQLAASADGTVVAVGGANYRLDVWDTNSGRIMLAIGGDRHHGQFCEIIVSRDGQRAAFSRTFGERELWAREDDRFRRRPLPSALQSEHVVAVSEDCLWAVARGRTAVELGVWSLEDGTQHASCVGAAHPMSGGVVASINSRSGRMIVALGNGQIELFDARSGKLLKTITTSLRAVPVAVELSSGGRWAVLIGYLGASRGWTASIIDLEAGAVLRSEPLPIPHDRPAFSSDSRAVAIIGRSGRPTLYGLPGAKSLGQLGDADTWAVAAVGPDRWALLSPGRLELRNRATGTTTVLWRDRTLDELSWVGFGIFIWLMVTVRHVRHARKTASPM